MCDSNSQMLIDQVVNGKVGQKESFTAFDISVEVKRRGGTERHRYMKDYIHSAISNEVEFGDYSKTSIPIPGGNPPYAILYYHNSIDPSTYKPFSRDAMLKPTQIETLNTIAATDLSDDGSDSEETVGVVEDGSFLLDTRDRLLIPTKFIRDIGLKPGDHAFLCEGSNSLHISPNSTNSFTELTVERSGEIRVSSTSLTRAGIFDKMGYEISVENNEVIVTKKD